MVSEKGSSGRELHLEFIYTVDIQSMDTFDFPSADVVLETNIGLVF
ncbi:hypothetical protein RRG08_064406 [Elysia crispata]|uniref:Uncharacterized protein n=1 Tax=Elysia crispata TaxID=231223 RepID=A0AAE1D9U7_9GAST|nr:hypothetical protein RRG08_064406 [Elysia crispata]